MTTLQLGPFDLEKPIARGGMGEVWSGRHREQGVPVAVKIVRATLARDTASRHAFRNEIQAVASLDHPAIVMIFDYGDLPHSLETASRGRLTAGSPYLVVEMATGGSLESTPTPLCWADLQTVLVTLLDAVAHAHARGVVHRDLKPANVLVCSEKDLRPGIRITDFGIAQALRSAWQESAEHRSMGTPGYMAPEQYDGRWRDYGPWTDLYALGCIAFELATGSPPFGGQDPVQMAVLHLTDDRPPIPPELGLPTGFEEWIHRLLAVDPGKRYRWAADAAWDLRGLGDPTSEQELTEIGQKLVPAALLAGLTAVPEPPDTRPVQIEALGTPAKEEGRVVPPPLPGQEPSPPSFETPPPPPVPSHWKRPAAPKPSMRLVGTGLRLFGLRSIRVVGREQERDVIWGLLREVHHSGQAAGLLLRGPGGVGKSRLAQWTAQRGHETGAVTVLRGYHSPTPGPGDGTAGLVRRYLRCGSLERTRVLQRIEAELRRLGVEDPYDWRALTELVHPAADDELFQAETRVRFASHTERAALLYRLFRRISRERPLLVWLDDVQWGADSVRLARHILDQQEENPAPVLLLLTVDEEAMHANPEVSAGLEDLLASPRASALAVGPLPKQPHRALIYELLNLEGDLARQVEARTEGNPLFAVQLVGDWVEREILKVGEKGFVLRGGAEAELPDDLYQLWADRIDGIAGEDSDQAARALEVAAVLGREVHWQEWGLASRKAGVELDPELPARLFALRLAVPGAEGSWHFAHGMLREALQRRANELGRWEDCHRACAEALQEIHAVTGAEVAERVGRHLFEAGLLEDALDFLLQGAQGRRESSDLTEAQILLSLRDEALTRSNTSRVDHRWGDGWVLRSWVSSNQGRHREALYWAERAVGAARRQGWKQVLPSALLGLGVALRELGELDRAERTTREALELVPTTGDRIGEAHGLQNLAVIARLKGQLTLARDLLTRAAELHGGQGNQSGVAQCLLRLAEVAHLEGQLVEAEAFLTEARSGFRLIGERLGVAHCEQLRGHILRTRGDTEEARNAYQDAFRLFDELGSSSAVDAQSSLALTALASGDHLRGAEILETVRAELDKMGQQPRAGALAPGLLPAAARKADWDAWDRLLADYSRTRAQDESADPDMARCLLEAGDLARQAGHRSRARRVLELARDHWNKLQSDGEIWAVEKMLSEMDKEE